MGGEKTGGGRLTSKARQAKSAKFGVQNQSGGLGREVKVMEDQEKVPEKPLKKRKI